MFASIEPSWCNCMQRRGMRLVYAAEEHGRDLQTLYQRAATCFSTQRVVASASNMASIPCAMLLLVESMDNGHIFGAFSSHIWTKSNASFYGNGTSFLFRLYPEPAEYKWASTPPPAAAGEEAGELGKCK